MRIRKQIRSEQNGGKLEDKTTVIAKEILNPTPIKSGGRIENNLRSYLLACDEPS